MHPELYVAAINDDFNYLENLAPDQKLRVYSESAPNQNNLLHIATQFRATETARAIAKNYPQLLWKQNSAGDSPLHVAAREGLQDLVGFFIDCAMVENGRSRSDELFQMVNCNKDTSLHCAARLGHLNSMEKLVRADPNPCSMLNKVGESPLFLAVAVGFWECPKIIIDHAESLASYKGPKGLTALHPTLYLDDYPIDQIRSLVEWRREMIKEQDCLGWTPLHYASLFGRTEVIKLFLQEQSSAIYILGKKEESALHIAAHQGHIDAMKEIINCCPDSCYLVDENGRTPLHTAVLSAQTRVVKFILETPMCAPVMNKPDNDGNMPLHLATHFKLYAIVKVLTKEKYGVNLKTMNNNFLTALDMYNKHNEEGLKASATRYLLQTEIGTMTMQHLAEKEIGKMNKEVVLFTSDSGDTKIGECVKKEISDLEKENALDVTLLVATLVATVTFAAALSTPGWNTKEILSTKLSGFQVFVIFNTLAFCSSVFAVLLQFHTSLTNHSQRVRYMGIVSFFTTIAIVAMFVAFASGTHVVLTKSSKISLTPYVISATFVSLYFVLPICDPGVEGFSCLTAPQNLVRGIVVRCIR